MEVGERATSSSDFGILLRRYRLAAGLSQEALAERARMSIAGVSALERGHRRSPQRATLGILAGALALDEEQRREFEAAAFHPRSSRRGGSVTFGPWPDAAQPVLPLALTSFVGRETELKEIATLVRAHRLVTLTGSGGVGKTQTALRVAGALRDADDSAVFFVGLAPLGDGSLIPSAIASALGVQEVPDRPLLETLITFLRSKTLLLVFDNCEHVIAEAGTVAHTLLLNCANLRILTTSREALRTAGERAYRLPSLSIAESVELFADRACAIDHRFSIGADDAAIADLCRRLDGIPLAIELAAARTNLLPVKVLAEKLDDRLRLLSGGERTALPRQQTMRATIEWSYELLSAQEQRIFERLSVFAAGCTLESALAVCADSDVTADKMLEVLAALVDKSLVIADIDGYECRYCLLESFRQFAAERLTVLGQQELITHRFVRACLEVAKQVDRSYEFGPDGVWRAIADAELHNWRAALAWCLLDRHDVELGQRLAAQLHGALGRFALDGRHWLDVALELVDERTPRDLLARLYSARARVAEMYRDWQAALRYNEAAISLFESTSDPLEIAWAQFGAGWSLLGIGRNSEAGAQLQEALLVRKYGNSRVVGYTLRQLSVVSANEGDLARARSYVTEAMQVHCELGLDVEVAWCKWQLGEFEMFEGNIEAALQTDIEVLETFRHFDVQVWGTGWVLCHLVGRLVVLRRYDDSVRCTGEALALTSEQAPALVAPLLECLAWSVALREDEKTADDVHAKAARLMGFAQVEPRESLLKGWWQEPHDRAIDALCKSIGHDAVTRCMGEGAALSPDLAVELARSLCAQNCLA